VTTIDVRRAAIRTATVEIQALKIDGKQMTLAVFRQLPERKIQGRSTIWGWGNYHRHDCGLFDQEGFEHDADGVLRSIGPMKHIHMVWSDGERLYRHTVRQVPALIESYRSGYPQLFIAL
jgi:hypothetical protein